jgi:IS5 family transposase
MRDLYHAQLSLTSQSNHPRAEELAVMSQALDANLDILNRVRQDLLRPRKADAKKGREGMSAEQVLRAALIKQMFSFSYSELSFHLDDSNQVRGFCRLSPSAKTPMKSALQSNIGALRAETWETVNKAIVLHARACKVESGHWMRTDTTVVESNIHPPLDSTLLWDGVRVLTRIMQRAHDKYGTTRTNYKRRAKRRWIAILNAGRMNRRVPLYRDLLKVTHKTVRAAELAARELAEAGGVVYALQLEHGCLAVRGPGCLVSAPTPGARRSRTIC